MKPEKINILIAEHLGWTFSPLTEADPTLPSYKKFQEDAICCWVRPGGSRWQLQMIPNYCGDLNAMNEAEKSLSDKDYDRFEELIYDYTADELPLENVRGLNITRGIIRAVSATAAQRAEAFLKTIGKWEE